MNWRLFEIKKWEQIEIIPRVKESVYYNEILGDEECKDFETFSGFGFVSFVSLRKDIKGFYYEIQVVCEDE